ncbi:MAG: TRAM domain-containing protein, partial [Pseudomonadota bacterium]
EKMAARVGTTMTVLVDEVDEEGAVARSYLDAPEIDGNVFIDDGFEALSPGDMVEVEIDEAAEYDLWGRPA